MVENDPYYINKLAVTKIWRAYVFGRLTDLYGDIPFSEAAKGNTEQFIIAPVYDTQKSIYISLLDELKAAVSQIDKSTNLGTFQMLNRN